MAKTRLLKTAKEIFRLSFKEWLIFNGTIVFNRLRGRWRYPIPTSGDLETMTRKDLIYWLYKCQHPITRATRNAGLEEFFKRQESVRCELPQGFQVMSEISLSAVGDLMDHPFLPNSG